MAIAGVAFLGVASVATAQSPQGAPDGPHMGRQSGMSKMLFNGIELTDAQKAQVEQINQKYKAQREALRPAGGQMQGPPDDATRAKMDAIRTQAHAEYRGFLNADQQKIFDQNVAEMKSRMEQRRHKGSPGQRA
jgi:Spy/CpxP family protein refolding chaperone